MLSGALFPAGNEPSEHVYKPFTCIGEGFSFCCIFVDIGIVFVGIHI